MIRLSLRDRVRSLVLCGALGVALVAAPGAAPSTPQPVCCFLISVNVKGSITSTYTRHGDAYVLAGGRDWEGVHSASWTWSSREFIEIKGVSSGDAYTLAVSPPGASKYSQRFIPAVVRGEWNEHAEFASWFCAVLRCKDKRIIRQPHGTCDRFIETLAASSGYIRAKTDKTSPLSDYLGALPGGGNAWQVYASDPIENTVAACGELTGGESRHGYGSCPLAHGGQLEGQRPDSWGPWVYSMRAPSVLTLIAQFKKGFSKTFTWDYNHGPSTGSPLEGDHTTTGGSSVILRASYFPRGQGLAAHIKAFQKEFPVHKPAPGKKLWNDDRPCGHKGP